MDHFWCMIKVLNGGASGFLAGNWAQDLMHSRWKLSLCYIPQSCSKTDKYSLTYLAMYLQKIDDIYLPKELLSKFSNEAFDTKDILGFCSSAMNHFYLPSGRSEDWHFFLLSPREREKSLINLRWWASSITVHTTWDSYLISCGQGKHV